MQFILQITTTFILQKKALKDINIKIYESDVIPEERYLMERFIYGSVEINSSNIQIITNPEIQKCNYKPDFKLLSFDIETGTDGSIYSFGLHQTYKKTEIKEVLIRSDQIENNYIDNFIHYIKSEKELITAFINRFNELDPDIIIGWHVIGFDFSFIERRARDYKIPFNIGRNNDAPYIKKQQW